MSATTQQLRDGDDLNDEASGGLRGFLRAYMRRFVKNLSLGSLPIQHHSKTIGRAVGNVNQALDVSQALSEADVKDKQAKQGYVTRFRAAAPVLVKNSILGSLQFGAYNAVMSKAKATLELREEYHAIPLSLCAGFASGAAYGAGYLTWDQLAGSFAGNKRPLLGVSRRGTMLLHSLSHCMLFTSYQSMRYLLHPAPSSSAIDEDTSNDENKQVEIVHRILSVTVSGFIAGTCEEMVNHRYGPLESKRGKGWKRASLKSLSKRSLLLAGIPSAVGFLALELSS